MAGMDPEDVRAYLLRWPLVRAIEVEELRRASSETKLRQLEALFGSRHLFGSDPNRSAEESEARERWARLRRILSA